MNTTPVKIAGDPVLGPIRAEICDQYIAAGKPQPEKNWLYCRLVEQRFNHHKLVQDMCQAFNEVTVLAEELQEGEFRSGVQMALEELRERLGIELEVETEAKP